MKAKLLAIALATVAVFSLTTATVTEISANSFDTCKVNEPNTEFYVTATDKFIKLKKGTLLSWTNAEMHQGVIVVKARVGKRWIRGEIKIDSTTCQ